MSVRIGADSERDADEQQHDEVGALTPAGHGGGECEHDQREPHGDEPDVLRVLHAGLDPGPELVATVEEPVAEAAQ